MLVFGVGFVARTMVLGSLETELENARSRAASLRTEYLDTLARDARSRHLESWVGAGVTWSDHVGELAGLLPAPGDGPLDSVSLASDPVVSFAKGSSTPYPGTWGSSGNARITLEGRASSREVSTGLRERVLADGRYALSVRGADVADRFSVELRPEGGRDE